MYPFLEDLVLYSLQYSRMEIGFASFNKKIKLIVEVLLIELPMG